MFDPHKLGVKIVLLLSDRRVNGTAHDCNRLLVKINGSTQCPVALYLPRPAVVPADPNPSRNSHTFIISCMHVCTCTPYTGVHVKVYTREAVSYSTQAYVHIGVN